MRISVLSRQSGVPVATIKFYLREQLLPPGTPTARNQAEYDEEHLIRLKLIRVLTGIGMMSIASVREVLAAIDDNCLAPQAVAKVVTKALLADYPTEDSEPGVIESALGRIDQLVHTVGWRVEPEAPAKSTLAQVFAALQYLGWDDDSDAFRLYVSAADALARHELDQSPQETAATAVARTVLNEVAFAAMRRMAYEHYLALRVAGGTAPEEAPRAD
ncbi:MerR family transcriptional regulator [Micromonospora sp. NBC_01796]|uniref:MerR family transcriptional regulator n=1 Tax=Micromonospora sp. NBC_01796 TaxID=2975987 RepID=UPI002DDAF633|nr:MerR family transcriptional regulator [Micromonospora sp. NBC_01796]WSA87447.1 MerR family transcriptional regulator [Micromonospora sp. NBC_01796]